MKALLNAGVTRVKSSRRGALRGCCGREKSGMARKSNRGRRAIGAGVGVVSTRRRPAAGVAAAPRPPTPPRPLRARPPRRASKTGAVALPGAPPKAGPLFVSASGRAKEVGPLPRGSTRPWSIGVYFLNGQEIFVFNLKFTRGINAISASTYTRVRARKRRRGRACTSSSTYARIFRRSSPQEASPCVDPRVGCATLCHNPLG